jgi:protein-S-isoprenylcysteine O-methyltransferase Ste14
MIGLTGKAFIGIVVLFLIMAALLFGGAGTVDWWQAWAFLAVYFGASLALTLYLVKRDRALLERRMRGGPWAEKQPVQRFIMLVASVAFIALILVPALDRRFGWSHMPTAVALGGDLMVALGWLGIFLVFRENSFTSATIELAPDQTVIATGPYAIVRHPMYASAFVMVLGAPIALGSWWGVVAVMVMMPPLIWRLLDEERFLAKNLPGYTAYKAKVRYRLMPDIW